MSSRDWKLAFLIVAALVAAVLFQPVPEKVSAGSQFATILCDNFKPISASANVQLVAAGNANMFINVCSYNLSNGNVAATPFSIVEGTGATCATNTAAVVGTTTAANGVTLGAAGGTVNYGGGSGVVAKTAVAGDNLCLFVSQGPVAGVIGVTQTPF